MALNPGRQRRLQRAVHLAAGLLLVAYVYLPLPPVLEASVRYVVLPAAVVTGIAMWQAARIRRLRMSLRAAPPTSGRALLRDRRG
jgi:thiosulfate reductase cytochrome b subunit